jgi:hypothetical protein
MFPNRSLDREEKRYIRNRSRQHEVLLATCFQAGFLLGLSFDPEDGGDMFLRNVGWLSRDYTA